MEKIMLVGRTGVGKTSFCQAMKGETLHYHKTQAVQLLDNAIDTPGEYIENRALYRALIVTAAEADLIVLMQDCTDEQCVFAPGFTSMFGKPAMGIVTKTDLASDRKALEDAREKLELAGCETIFYISNTKREGIEKVKEYIEQTRRNSQKD